MEDFDISAAVDGIGDDLGFDTIEEGTKLVNDAVDDTTKLLEAPAGTPAAPTPAPAPAPAPAPTAATPAPAPAVPDPLLAAPKTWRPEVAAKWETLDPTVRAEVLKREEDMFRGIEGYKADAGFGKSMKQVLDPYLPVLRANNIDPMQQVAGLMQAHQTLALGTPDQKQQLFLKIASDYGIDLKSLPTETAWVDPEVANLRKKLEGVESRLSAADTERLQNAHKEQEASVNRFAADPANVHFSLVLPDMLQLVEKGAATSLQDAYEKAVWTNPQARAAEIARQQTEASAKAQAEAEAKTAAAKAAAAANVRTRAKSGSAAAPLKSMEDTMSAAFDKIANRS
jgi:hypothetical protein